MEREAQETDDLDAFILEYMKYKKFEKRLENLRRTDQYYATTTSNPNLTAAPIFIPPLKVKSKDWKFLQLYSLDREKSWMCAYAENALQGNNRDSCCQ